MSLELNNSLWGGMSDWKREQAGIDVKSRKDTNLVDLLVRN